MNTLSVKLRFLFYILLSGCLGGGWYPQAKKPPKRNAPVFVGCQSDSTDAVLDSITVQSLNRNLLDQKLTRYEVVQCYRKTVQQEVVQYSYTAECCFGGI